MSEWKTIETAPTDLHPILCGFKGQFVWVFFVAGANGKDTNLPGYAAPTHWTEIQAPA